MKSPNASEEIPMSAGFRLSGLVLKGLVGLPAGCPEYIAAAVS